MSGTLAAIVIAGGIPLNGHLKVRRVLASVASIWSTGNNAEGAETQRTRRFCLLLAFSVGAAPAAIIR